MAARSSAGGRDAVSFVLRLSNRGVRFSGLVTLDIRSTNRLPAFGAKVYNIPDHVPAYNFYQRSPINLGPNTFNGARLSGARVVNIDLTGVTDHVHITGYFNRNFTE